MSFMDKVDEIRLEVEFKRFPGPVIDVLTYISSSSIDHSNFLTKKAFIVSDGALPEKYEPCNCQWITFHYTHALILIKALSTGF